MENDTQEEVIIEPQETNEAEEQTEQVEVQPKKEESLEDKRARLQRQLAQVDKKLGIKDEPKVEQKKSDSLDYGQKAYLASMGYKDKAEIKLAQEIMKESGKDLEAVLESKYFKSEVENMRELARTAAATPTGKRSGQVPTDSVEYWLGKPFEDVPKELREKVVNAQIAKEKSKGVFYNS